MYVWNTHSKNCNYPHQFGQWSPFGVECAYVPTIYLTSKDFLMAEWKSEVRFYKVKALYTCVCKVSWSIEGCLQKSGKYWIRCRVEHMVRM